MAPPRKGDKFGVLGLAKERLAKALEEVPTVSVEDLFKRTVVRGNQSETYSRRAIYLVLEEETGGLVRSVSRVHWVRKRSLLAGGILAFLMAVAFLVLKYWPF